MYFISVNTYTHYLYAGDIDLKCENSLKMKKPILKNYIPKSFKFTTYYLSHIHTFGGKILYKFL